MKPMLLKYYITKNTHKKKECINRKKEDIHNINTDIPQLFKGALKVIGDFYLCHFPPYIF